MKPTVQFYQKLLSLLEKFGGKEIKGINVELASDFQQLSDFARKLGGKISPKFDQAVMNSLLSQVGVKNQIMEGVNEFLVGAFKDLSSVRHDIEALKVWWMLHNLLWKGFDANFLHFDKVIRREGNAGIILVHVSNLDYAVNSFDSYWSCQKPVIKKTSAG